MYPSMLSAQRERGNLQWLSHIRVAGETCLAMTSNTMRPYTNLWQPHSPHSLDRVAVETGGMMLSTQLMPRTCLCSRPCAGGSARHESSKPRIPF